MDAVVPVTATRFSLAQLKLDTTIPWYPWYVKKQVSEINQFKYKIIYFFPYLNRKKNVLIIFFNINFDR